jgi:hypothetical protein
MEINLVDLELGDEFLYAMHGNLVRAKVIRPVQPKKVQPTQGKTYYKSVKCQVAVKETSYTTNWGGNTRTFTKREYNASDNYTIEKFVDLNYRNIWLIKKGKQ